MNMILQALEYIKDNAIGSNRDTILVSDIEHAIDRIETERALDKDAMTAAIGHGQR